MLDGGGIDAIYAVGPVPMMRAIAELTRPYGVPTFASLNAIMLDGTGMCGGCRVQVGGKTVYACVDGPEFDAHAVDFRELADRLGTYREFESHALEVAHQRAATKEATTVAEAPLHAPAGSCLIPALAENAEKQEAAAAAGRAATRRAMTDQPTPAPDEGAEEASPGDSGFQPAFDHPLTPKERMTIERVHMPEQDALARAANFREVNLGYTEQLAVLEAERCLQCKNPVCIDGCPVRVNIPRFIELLRIGDMAGAAASLLGDNALPCVTGRVCPQEIQCEGVCVRAKKGSSVAIGALERYVADWAMDHPEALPPAHPEPTARKVAIVGSGPAGLTAAKELIGSGHEVTIFEAFHATGGVLIYGIPEFRLPKDIVQSEVDRLVAAGVKIETNAIIGRTYTLRELRDRFDAVYLAVGAGLPVFMNVPGENFKGVYSANEYLTRVNLMGAWNPESDTPVLHGHRVVVVGGGNVAMDSVRTAKRLGADEATIVYRRGKAELPARIEEVHHAEQEGIQFEFQVAPIEVLGRREPLGHRDPLPAHGARRARRVGPAPARADRGLRVRHRLRDGRRGHRDEGEPAADGVGAGPRDQPLGLHRHRRLRDDDDPRRLRRRRHRARRGDRHPGHGRRQALGPRHRRLAARPVPARRRVPGGRAGGGRRRSRGRSTGPGEQAGDRAATARAGAPRRACR